MISVILAIDAGSSSIRCTGYEPGNAPSSASRPMSNEGAALPTSSATKPIDGIAHKIQMSSIDISTGYIRIHEVLSAIDTCIDQVLALLRQKYPGAFQIVGVGFSSFAMNLCAVNLSGEPVGDSATLSYACNRQDVVNECQKLKSNLGQEKLDALYQRTGTPMHTSYALPQLLAFYAKDENQDLIKQTAKWKTISSICLDRWTGKPNIEIPISYSEASWTGMLNFRTGGWDDEVVDLLDICYDAYSFDETDMVSKDDLNFLPQVMDYDSELPILVSCGIPEYCWNGYANAYFDRWPEFRSNKLNLYLGLGDGAAANVGSKSCGYSSSDSGRIAVTVGTSATARICLHMPLDSISYHHQGRRRDIIIPQGLFCYRVDRFTVLIGGALTDGGSVIEWARQLLNYQDPQAFNGAMEEASAMYNDRTTNTSPDSITMIPFFSGERSTGFRGGATACISGITRATTPIPQMNRLSQATIIASGNALEQNALWRQMLADCSSMNVVVDNDSSEGSSRGVAIMISGTLQTRPAQWHVQPLYAVEEPLAPSLEAKANSSLAVHQYWVKTMNSQEALIGAVSPTWNHA